MIPEGLSAPLRTIYCVGRNYAAHAKELGNEVPETPLVFLKPASAALASGGILELPKGSSRVDHEVEVVVGIGEGGRRRYAVGIDFTARDWQADAKKKGDPWLRSKGQRGFAALGPFVDAEPPFAFSLSVNGKLRQKGATKDMTFSIDALLAHVGETYGLGPGDVVFTGTPEGVAPLAPGDAVEAKLGDGLSILRVAVR
jgi:2-keto-4-pentenoate hydratase/2-oxohepta-3-ene-1,7-dioic acid hydratase in catechol pathway